MYCRWFGFEDDMSSHEGVRAVRGRCGASRIPWCVRWRVCYRSRRCSSRGAFRVRRRGRVIAGVKLLRHHGCLPGSLGLHFLDQRVHYLFGHRQAAILLQGYGLRDHAWVRGHVVFACVADLGPAPDAQAAPRAGAPALGLVCPVHHGAREPRCSGRQRLVVIRLTRSLSLSSWISRVLREEEVRLHVWVCGRRLPWLRLLAHGCKGSGGGRAAFWKECTQLNMQARSVHAVVDVAGCWHGRVCSVRVQVAIQQSKGSKTQWCHPE